jgi:hypothetical protein
MNFLLWELGYTTRVTSGSSALCGNMGASFLWYYLRGPFVARVAQGEEDYP